MKERAGPDSQVIATDINTDWMGESMPSDVEIRRHDIGVDPLPEATFDVIHARAVLTFVPAAAMGVDADARRLEARRLDPDRGDGASVRGIAESRRMIPTSTLRTKPGTPSLRSSAAAAQT